MMEQKKENPVLPLRNDPVFKRNISKLCQSERLVSEILSELAEHPMLAPYVEQMVQRYAALLEIVKALGVDKMPPNVLLKVRR